MRTVDVAGPPSLTLTEQIYRTPCASGGISCTVVLQSAAASSRSDSSLLLRLPQDVQSHIRGFLPLFPDRIRLCQLNRAAKNTSWTEDFSLCCRTCETCWAGDFERCSEGRYRLPLSRVQTIVSRSSSSLKHLVLSGCVDLGDAQLLSMLPHMRRIETLDLSRCRKLTDASVMALVQLPTLRRLNLRDLTGVTDASLEALADLPRLEALVLLGCGRVTDKGVLHLTKLRATLRVLNLWGAHNVTDASMCVLADRMHDLEELNVRYCHRLTDKSLSKVTSQLTNLRFLNLRYCPRITDATVEAFSTHMANLRVLNLSHCHRLTDATLATLVSHSSLRQSLRALRLWECKGLSANGLLQCLSQLSTQAPQLCFVDLRGCSVTVEEAMSAMNESAPPGTDAWLSPAEGRLSRGLEAFGSFGSEKQSSVSDLAVQLA